MDDRVQKANETLRTDYYTLNKRINYAVGDIIQISELLDSVRLSAFDMAEFNGHIINETGDIEAGKKIAARWAERFYLLIYSSLLVAVDTLQKLEDMLQEPMPENSALKEILNEQRD